MVKFDYVKHGLLKGAPFSNEDVFVLAKAIASQFLCVDNLYDVETVSIHLGHFCPTDKRLILTSTSKPNGWGIPSAIGTYHGNEPASFKPLEVDGVHYTDSKPHYSTNGEYAEDIECVIVEDPLAYSFSQPAKSFWVDKLNSKAGAIVIYFCSDSKLVYLPCQELTQSESSLGYFAATIGQIINFDLVWHKHVLPDIFNGEPLARYSVGRVSI